LVFLAAMALAAVPSVMAPSSDADVCMRAAAAVTQSRATDIDRAGCTCTVDQLKKLLSPADYDLHEKMEEILAFGADEKSFNKQLSDVMLKRGMNQADADAFLSRARMAEARAKDACAPVPLQ